MLLTKYKGLEFIVYSITTQTLANVCFQCVCILKSQHMPLNK